MLFYRAFFGIITVLKKSTHRDYFMIYNFQMIGKPIPKLPHNFNVEASSKSEIEDKISSFSGVDVTILFIDVLDQDGLDHDTVLSVDGSYHSHKAYVSESTLI